MPTIVIGTTLLAALLHACWNALAKGAADKHLSMAGVIIGHLLCDCWAAFRSDAGLGVLAVSPRVIGAAFWLSGVFVKLL